MIAMVYGYLIKSMKGVVVEGDKDLAEARG
jgi:hypothetical protein